MLELYVGSLPHVNLFTRISIKFLDFCIVVSFSGIDIFYNHNLPQNDTKLGWVQ